MPIGVAEFEGGDTAGRCRQKLWAAGRDRAPSGHATKPTIGFVDIGNRDREMLKARIGSGCRVRIGAAGNVELKQFDELAPEDKRDAIGTGAGLRTAPGRQSAETHRLFIKTAGPRGILRNQHETRQPLDRDLGKGRHGQRTPRRLRKIAYSVCDPPMNRRFRRWPPNVRFDTR